MTELDIIAIGVAAVPDHYKERAFRYIRKILPSSLSKPQYTKLLKKLSEDRQLSVDERRLLNVCEVCQRAGKILEEDLTTFTTADNPYEDDWLSTFENESCHKSSEDMQERFARMLAGEIKRPGTFSIRAIKMLGQIDPETALAFRVFCSGCLSFGELGDPGIKYNSVFPKFEGGRFPTFLSQYGIDTNMYTALYESRLITEIEFHPLKYIVQNVPQIFIENSESLPIPFLYAGKYFLLKRIDDKKSVNWNFEFPGFFLSSLGNELITIVEPEPIKQLSEDLKEFFESKQLEMVEVELTDDKHWKPKLQ